MKLRDKVAVRTNVQALTPDLLERASAAAFKGGEAQDSPGGAKRTDAAHRSFVEHFQLPLFLMRSGGLLVQSRRLYGEYPGTVAVGARYCCRGEVDCPGSGATLSRSSRNAVLRGPGLSGEAELAVVTGCFTSAGEVLDALRRGAEDSNFEYPDTDRAVVEA